MAYYKGHTGKMMIGGDTLSVKSWEATLEAALLDTTSTTSGGKEQVEPGLQKFTFKCDAQWSAANNPLSSGVGISSGASCAVKLYCNTTDQIFDVTVAYIGKATVKNAVDGVVEWTLEGQGNAWTVTASTT